MAVHVRYNSWNISLPMQNNNVKWPNFALSGERKPPRLIFLNFYFKFTAVFQI